MFFSNGSSIPSSLSKKDYSSLEKLFSVTSKVFIVTSIILIGYIVKSVING